MKTINKKQELYQNEIVKLHWGGSFLPTNLNQFTVDSGKNHSISVTDKFDKALQWAKNRKKIFSETTKTFKLAINTHYLLTRFPIVWNQPEYSY